MGVALVSPKHAYHVGSLGGGLATMEVVKLPVLRVSFQEKTWQQDSELLPGRMGAEWEESWTLSFPALRQAPLAQGQAHKHTSNLWGKQHGLCVHSHLSSAAGRLWLLGIHSLIYPIELWVSVENSPGAAAIHQYSLLSPRTAAHSGLAQPVLTSSSHTEQRRIWEKLVLLVTPWNTPFTCDMTNISAIRISRSLIILNALTYIPNHYLI